LVAAELWQQIGTRYKREPLTGRLSMTINAYPPDKRKRDIDNLAKASIDAIGSTKLIFEDDSQIDHLSIHRCAVEKPGRLEIQIWEHDANG
jgi:crossover junction endodeoxyribonuclease RusA